MTANCTESCSDALSLVQLEHTHLPKVRERIRELNASVTDVLNTVETARLRAKSSFLLRTCGDKRHAKCGATGDDCCNKLSAKVYQWLKREKFAGEIQRRLQGNYPQFEWSVVTDMGDCHDRYFSAKAFDSVWIQKMTCFKKKKFKRGEIESRALRYGEILCQADWRRGMVFWTEAKNFVESSTLAPSECQKRVDVLLKNVTRRTLIEGEIDKWNPLYRGAWSGLLSNMQFSLANVNGQTYPSLVSVDLYFHYYYWPMVSDSVMSIDC
ncbi:hypothetical protein BV898_15625 [Hypsibius exemplaris]|uniref:Uncharacterized protein n=1 Tax=Hypsibius exemplaris TaxID=2072580 RepID=A0A9X6NEC6_HYPEX|nr:hypothetical protein BV898_15625 [Hypsibius exemplaris]